jgi:lysophospholipase L1-like esterase
MRFRREIVGALAALVLTACAAAGADSSTSDSSTSDSAVPSTVGDVGLLPSSIPVESSPLATDATSTTVAAETSGPTTSTTVVGAAAPGNRVLLIGDSILASTSRRYSNDMCDALVPLGWRVEVEAEVSRPINFADTVLDSRLKAGWDVVVIFLGTNYGNDEKDYLRRLNDAIVRIGDLPIVLVTVTEHDTEVHEVNDTIRAILEVYPNLSMVDWQQISSAQPELLREDGIHLTPDGRVALAAAMAEHLGAAPAEPGECLKSSFTDDSAGSVDGSGSSSGSSGSGTKPKPTATTVKPSSTATTVKPSTGATTTTVKPSGATTSSVPSTGSTTATTTAATAATTATTSAPASTSPPATQPPATQPPATQPPATSPPATSPPATTPPPGP